MNRPSGAFEEKELAVAHESIMVVEDDDNILELITYHLKQTGYAVVPTFTGEEALARAAVEPPDLILLDLMLPAMSGLAVCSQLKGDMATRTIPVIIVSARGADTDVVAGLEAGADGYLVKPFRPPVLLARVQEMLVRGTRIQPAPGDEFVCAGLHINPTTHEVKRAGDSIVLTELEFGVLHYLAQQAGRICTRDQILASLGLAEVAASGPSVDDLVEQLVHKLGDSACCIETIRRIGYQLKDTGS